MSKYVYTGRIGVIVITCNHCTPSPRTHQTKGLVTTCDVRVHYQARYK